jgi:superfamily II DNA or RNA helicase
MKEFKNYQEELKYLVTNSSRLDKMARLIKNANLDGNTLVLVDRLEAGRELEARIPDSVFLSGNSKSDLRQEHYDEVATAANKIIIATYGIASVGINIPRLFNLVLIEPGKSFVRVIQSIGRGLRIAKDKSYIQIYDLTSTCKYAKRHLTKRKTFYKEANYKFTVTKVSL